MVRNCWCFSYAAAQRVIAHCPLREDRRGVTAVEYALIAGIMVTAIILGLPAVGPHLVVTFNSVSSEL